MSDDAPGPIVDEPKPDVASEIARLSKLSRIEYDQARKGVAEVLGIRPATLDEEVAAARLADAGVDDGPVETLEPWPAEVDGAVLFVEIRDLLNRHVVLPDGAAEVIALWIFGTYCFDTFRLFPKLLVSSPEKRCGKTTLLETIEALVRRAVLTTGMTPAVLFRLVEVARPTLLLDEVDRWVTSDNLELVGVINAGHAKRSAYVWRVVGDDHTPTRFSVWGAMALAGIKTPADTIVDRSIHIEMRRKAPGESRAKLPADLFESCREIRQKLERWSIDHAEALRDAEPVVPKVGNDRAEDNWDVLLAIATVIGAEHYRRARDLFVAEHRDQAPEDTITVMLLSDIRDALKADRIFGDDMVDALVKLPDRPWCEWRHGKPITQNGLARLLKPFKVYPKTLRIGDARRKGYEAADLADAFRRYLPSGGVSTVTPCQSTEYAGSSDIHNRDATATARDGTDASRMENGLEATNGAGCHGVTDQTPGKREVRL